MEAKVSINKTNFKKNIDEKRNDKKNFKPKNKSVAKKPINGEKKPENKKSDTKFQHKSDGCYTWRPFEVFFKDKMNTSSNS